MALNLTNNGTIEFRLFRGTLDYVTFMATLELVDNIVDIARSGKIEGLKWNDIVTYHGEYIQTYVSNKNIVNTDTVLHIIEEVEEQPAKKDIIHKFNVGDIIQANYLSNFRYGITTQEHHWIGKVLQHFDSSTMYVKTLKCDGVIIGMDEFYVEEKYFDLYTD